VKNGKQTVACRVTFHKLNIDNHGIPQTAQYISFWVAGVGGTQKPMRVEANPKSLEAKVSSISLSALTSIE